MNKWKIAQPEKVSPPFFTPIQNGLLQRKCAWGQHTATSGSECEGYKKKRQGMFHRAAIDHAPVQDLPPLVREVLRSTSQTLEKLIAPVIDQLGARTQDMTK
jgi:hypothetical protein